MSDDSAPAIKAAAALYIAPRTRQPVYATIHKREYGEWCLPKGKLRPNEGWKDAAIRAVYEDGIRLQCS